MNFRPRRTIAAAVASLALLGLAGCGGSDDESSTSATSETASDTATETATATPSETATESDAADTSGDSGGLVDKLRKVLEEGKSAHVVMELGDQGSAEGDIVFGDSPAMSLKMSVGGQEAELRLIDGTMYMKQAALGDKWLKVSSDDLGMTAGIDPAEALENLQEYAGEATEVDDGHYQFEQSGVTSDLYFDDDGFISKMSVTGTGAGDITMTYSDWGEDVDIEAPDAGDVMEMPTS
ncbi:hypothetical protein [Nocardioides sp.]|uniref:hypothetical protein n=1 Tax=Nocardioides sp. TaxID=35761 RepID=UPI0039E677FE